MSEPTMTLDNSRFIAAVIRRRAWVVALWAVGVVLSATVYLTQFRIDNSVSIWFLEDDPELEEYRRYHAAFGKKEWTYVWLQGESVFSPEFLRDLRLLHDRIESLANVTRVVSLVDAGTVRPGLLGLPRFEKFLSMGSGEILDKEEVGIFREKIRGSLLFDGRLVPHDDDRYTLLAVETANRIDSIEPYRIRLINEIREADSSYPAIKDFGITGTAVINAELNRAAKRDMVVYYLLIAAFIFVGGGLVLRRSRDLVVLFAVVLGTVLPVMGGIAALGLPFNLMTVMLPTLLVTVSVSYLVHFISEFHAVRSQREAGGTREGISSAISWTFQQLLRPGLWTTVTTAIGFASLAVSPVAPIRQIGIAAAVGIALAWLNAITIAPALLSFLWQDCKEGKGRPPHGSKGIRIMDWLAGSHPFLAVLVGGALVLGASGLVRLEADTNYVEFFRAGSTVRKDYAQLSELGMPGAYLTITVRFPAAEKIGNLDRHLAMRRFEESIQSTPGVLDVQSLDQMLEQLVVDGDTASSPGGKSVRIGTLLALAGSDGIPEAGDFLSADGSQLRLRAMVGSMSTNELNAIRDRVMSLAGTLPDGWVVAVTGTNVLWANMDAHVVRTQMFSIGIVAAVLLVLLPFVFRSLVLGFLGFVVSFLPILCTLGTMAWIGLPVNIATCILGGVVIGLAVDDTIYFLFRVREGLLQGLSAGDAAQRAIRTTGRAMIKTSFILTGGFLTMAASDFLPSVYFGVFFAFSILIALLADLILLPILLLLTEGEARS